MRTACIAAGFLLLAGCGKPIPPTAGAPVAMTKQPAGQLMLPNASRQFLTVEPVAPGEFSATRTYFGRTAFRPKALSAVTAPFAGRVARVSIEPGQRVRAGATLFTIESPDAMGVRTALSQARLKVRLQEEVLARQTEMVKRGVGLEVERFE
ncbi:MAG: HlyD family efflux transporter periplasmic adaptor subunit, partial [Betaproteobacteria bacterium]